MRINSPAFTWILTGFNLRTRTISGAWREERGGGDPRLAGLACADWADRGTDGKGGNDDGAGQGGGNLCKAITGKHAGLLNPGLRPAGPCSGDPLCLAYA